MLLTPKRGLEGEVKDTRASQQGTRFEAEAGLHERSSGDNSLQRRPGGAGKGL